MAQTAQSNGSTIGTTSEIQSVNAEYAPNGKSMAFTMGGLTQTVGKALYGKTKNRPRPGNRFWLLENPEPWRILMHRLDASGQFILLLIFLVACYEIWGWVGVLIGVILRFLLDLLAAN